MSNVPETKVDPSLSTPVVPDQALHSRLDKMRADSTILGSMNKILGEYQMGGGAIRTARRRLLNCSRMSMGDQKMTKSLANLSTTAQSHYWRGGHMQPPNVTMHSLLHTLHKVIRNTAH